MQNDANLLFAILAVQLDFIRPDELIQAANQWMLDKTNDIGSILVERRALSREDRDFVDLIVRKHTQKSGSLESSLNAVTLRSGLSGVIPENGNESNDGLSRIAEELSNISKVPNPKTISFSLWNGKKGNDQFRIVRSLAHGGLGQVSVANDLALEREVAVKEILPKYSENNDAQARFVTEAKVTGALEHPGIVPIYAIGDFPDGRPFYVMRLIRGRSLQEAIKQLHAEKDSKAEFLKRIRPLIRHLIDSCNAIAYAHSRGVLHRDIKPNNIMLGKFGETLVVDWGLAKSIDAPKDELMMSEAPIGSGSSSHAPTEFGTVIGTPGYMSPEQAFGRLDLIDRRSDVFSLGATLYCILIGESPFHHDDRDEIVRRVRNNEFIRPKQRNHFVPKELDAITSKSLSHEPKHRFDSALELADDLERWLDGEPVHSYPEPIYVKTVRLMRQHQQLVLSGLLLMMLLSIGLVVFNQLITKERDATVLALKRAEQSSKTSTGIIAEFVKNLADAKWSQIPNMDEERLKMLDYACDRLSEEMEIAPDDRKLQENAVMIFVRAAVVNKTLARPQRAVEIFEKIAPMLARGDLDQLDDDALATYADALASYSSILGTVYGPQKAIEKNILNLKISRERYRRLNATQTQIGLVRALVEQAVLQNDLSEFAAALKTLDEASQYLQVVHDDSFRKATPFALELYRFQIEYFRMQNHIQLNSMESALSAHHAAREILLRFPQYPQLKRDGRVYDGRLDYSASTIYRGLGRTEESMSAVDSAIEKLDVLISEFNTLSYKRARLEALIEKGFYQLDTSLEIAKEIASAANESLEQVRGASTERQLLPIEFRLATLELAIAQQTNMPQEVEKAKLKMDTLRNAMEKWNSRDPRL